MYALEDAVGSTRRLLNEKHEASLPESPSGKVSLRQLTKNINVDYSKGIDKNGEPLASEIERYLTGADKPVTDAPLHKAHTHDTPHDIFKPHENPFIRGLGSAPNGADRQKKAGYHTGCKTSLMTRFFFNATAF